METLVSPEMEATDRGALYLDGVAPDWWKSIDIDNLDQGHANWCILGQRYGHYGSGFVQLHLTEDMARDMGFLYQSPEYYESERSMQDAYEALTQAWLVQIDRRRDEGS